MSAPNDWNRKVIDEFRANGGKVGGVFEGATLLLLHTQGAKSNQERINPLTYVRDGGDFVVVAAKGGAPTNPDWYSNIVAHPELTVEVGRETVRVRAAVAEEPERTRLFNKMLEMMPPTYQRRLLSIRKRRNASFRSLC